MMPAWWLVQIIAPANRRLKGVVLPIGLVAACGFAESASAQQWLTDANNRIEQYRKADLNVHVVDTNGNVVPGANVHVGMQRHSFGFGTAVTAQLINSGSPDASIYRENLLQNFNQVVFENDLKWPAWDGVWGNGFNWENTEEALDWLDANGLPARGHYLSWATWSGSDAWGTFHGEGNVPSSVAASVPERLLAHITDELQTVGNRVFEWDVINHPVGWLNDTYENRYGLDYYNEIVNHARSVAPEGMPMWINEDDVIAGNSRANDYERIIQYMIDNGAGPDGIGFQSHFIEEWGRLSSFNRQPQSVYDRIDRFAEFGLPLRATEFDIDVGDDEEEQAELMHDLLTVMFSHPSMEAITMWGFWEGSHWREDAALYRQDWSEKPALEAYQQLVFGDWWTDETGDADGTGDYATRAFKGWYDVTVTHDGQEFLLRDLLLGGDTSVEIVVDAAGLAGDYNEDGVVNAADYAVWRNQNGTSFDLPNRNPTLSGDVGQADYDYWVSNYGAIAGSSTAATAVPEPATACLALCALVALVRMNFKVR